MSHESHGHHISSPALLTATFVALVGLTILTVAMATVPLESVPMQDLVPMVFNNPMDLTWLDMPITLGIATAKALLVAVIFMHLQHDKLFNSILLIGAVLFTGLFIGMAVLDSEQYQPEVQEYSEYREAMANP